MYIINWHAVKRKEKSSLLGKRRRNGWRRTIEDAVIIVERAYKKSITLSHHSRIKSVKLYLILFLPK